MNNSHNNNYNNHHYNSQHFAAGRRGVEQPPATRPPQRRRPRRRLKRSVRRFLIMFVSVVLMLGLSFGLTSIIQGFGGSSTSSVLLPASTSTPTLADTSVSLPSIGAEGSGDAESWNFIGPVEQSTEQMQMVAPDYRMIALPENGRVDMSYFDTVTFVGDSITQGLQLWKTIPNAHFSAYRSINPREIYNGTIQTNMNGEEEVPIDAVVASQPDNIYVLLGTNTMMSYSDEDLLAYYSNMLDAFIERLPGVGIYVQSITPVVAGIDPRFDMDRIRSLNDQLAKMAWEKGLYFLDLHEALADENGDMRPEYGSQSDGYHMTAAGCDAWLEYLLTHTAYHPRNPYLEGSHYYQQLPTPTEEAPAAEAVA